MFEPIHDKEIRQQEGHQVHETVIPELKGSDLNKGRTDMIWYVLPEINESIHVPRILKWARDVPMYRLENAVGMTLSGKLPLPPLTSGDTG